MIKILNIIIIIFLGKLLAQNYEEKKFLGEIDILTQRGDLSIFSTKIDANNFYLYTMDRNDSIYFKKKYELQPIDIIISKLYEKIVVCFYTGGSDGESYSYQMHNLVTGLDEDFPPLYSRLKLARGEKFLYGSTHLFDNGSPLDVYNFETKEHFIIELRDWICVTSMSGNRLVILQQLSERNRKKLKFEEELRAKRIEYINKSNWNKNRYRNGEISESQFFIVEDSLKKEYISFKSKKPKGTWTQLGTRLWVYDLEKKAFVFNMEIKDLNDNIIILHRDDSNSYSLSIDDEDYIYIYGTSRNNSTPKNDKNVYLKYNSDFKLVWSKTKK